MKRLNDLRKSLPSNARLNGMEHTRIKGGNGDKRTEDGRPSNGNAWGKGKDKSNNGNGNGKGHAYGHN